MAYISKPFRIATLIFAGLSSREYYQKDGSCSQGIHVAHVIIDGVISGTHEHAPAPDKLSPDAIAEEYWRLHTQDRTTWTHELDLRPLPEKF